MNRRWCRADFCRPADELAPALLGHLLVRQLDDGARLAGRIIETEAYLGRTDRAAHTFGGRKTRRNQSMYMRPGTAYIYFVYGMHHCCNIVCGEDSADRNPVAVLLRAIEPMAGAARMLKNRGLVSGDDPRLIGSGPAKLCRAFDLDRSSDGLDLTNNPGLWVEEQRMPLGPGEKVARTPRIGVDYAGPWARRLLRWVIRDHPHRSK